jgi:hypothetical protein
LPAEIERTICCPSGGAAEGHFEDEEEAAACWVDVIVIVVGGVGVLVCYTEGISTMNNEIGQRFFHQKNEQRKGAWKLQKLRFLIDKHSVLRATSYRSHLLEDEGILLTSSLRHHINSTQKLTSIHRTL